MRVKIYPSKVHGTVAIPSSKSMAHRALICASLAKGCSTLSGITPSKDIEATISCMQALGAKIEKVEDNYIVHGTDLQVQAQNTLCDCHIAFFDSGSFLNKPKSDFYRTRTTDETSYGYLPNFIRPAKSFLYTGRGSY